VEILGQYELLEHVADDPPWRLFRARRIASTHPYREGSEPGVDGDELILRWLRHPPSDEGEWRALEEGRLASTLRHENVEPILEWSVERQLCVEPISHGWRLNLILERATTVAVSSACRIARDLCAGLTSLHDRQSAIVHGDVRTHRVLITTGGQARLRNPALAIQRPVPAILSLGAPKIIERISPEMIIGRELDHRSDLYQLGVILYELLVGAPPSHRQTPDLTLDAIVTASALAPSRWRADVTPRLDELVLSCLEKKPEARPQSAAEVASALDDIRAAEGWPHEDVALQELLIATGLRSKARIAGYL
jgi:eukaryotic-like serine/threonine-protein kinase